MLEVVDFGRGERELVRPSDLGTPGEVAGTGWARLGQCCIQGYECRQFGLEGPITLRGPGNGAAGLELTQRVCEPGTPGRFPLERRLDLDERCFAFGGEYSLPAARDGSEFLGEALGEKLVGRIGRGSCDRSRRSRGRAGHLGVSGSEVFVGERCCRGG